jgi:hypothetical protein
MTSIWAFSSFNSESLTMSARMPSAKEGSSSAASRSTPRFMTGEAGLAVCQAW